MTIQFFPKLLESPNERVVNLYYGGMVGGFLYFFLVFLGGAESRDLSGKMTF